MKARLAFAAAVLLSVTPLAAAETTRKDHVRIVAIDPADRVSRGVEVEFRIDVEVDLETADEGHAMVGFNTVDPVRFTMVDSRRLARGTQQFSFTVKVVPVDWGERGPFVAMVNVGPRADGANWFPTASARRDIPLLP